MNDSIEEKTVTAGCWLAATASGLLVLSLLMPRPLAHREDAAVVPPPSTCSDGASTAEGLFAQRAPFSVPVVAVGPDGYPAVTPGRIPVAPAPMPSL